MLWYEETGNDSDVAISTRIRLARNLQDTPFPNALNNEDRKNISKKISDTIINGNSALAKDFELIQLDDLSQIEKQVMSEQHLISPAMLEGSGHSVLNNQDKSMSIMLMEEDHIRLQIITAGFNLEHSWNLADKVDSVMEENLKYAFDENLGYLTSCPTNLGTGLRASVMLHLPALVLTEQLPRCIDSVNKLGITVRGLYGEGSEAQGNLFQFSNQITMGLCEKEIIQKLKNVVLQIIDKERQMREYLKSNNFDAVSDKIWRSFGTLKYARTITSKEAKMLISDVRLGQKMGIIPNESINLMELSVITEPASIMKNKGKTLNHSDRDKIRADIIREKLNSIK